jgi:hypothetical protein
VELYDEPKRKIVELSDELPDDEKIVELYWSYKYS